MPSGSEAKAHLEAAIAAQRRGQIPAAEALYREALVRDPSLVEAHANLAVLLQQSGRTDEAEAALAAALALEPAHFGLHLNLGNLYRHAGELERAEACYRRAVELNPRYAGGHLNLGALYHARGLGAEAEAALRAAVELAPENALAHFNLGNVLRDTDPPAAAAAFREAARLAPEFFDAHLNLGAALYDLADFDGAEAALDRALGLCPGDPRGLANLGNVRRAQGRIEEALKAYERALAGDPECIEARLGRAITWLLTGDFARGWAAYEVRWADKAKRGPLRRFAVPEWRGEPAEGRAILVYGEQGPGDVIMFSSCLPELIATAGRVFVQVRGSLAPLLARSFPEARVSTDRVPATGAWRTLPEGVERVVALGRLGRFFRPHIDAFPARRRYLRPDPAAVRRWRERHRALGPGLKVGISWRGGFAPVERRLRTSVLADWASLLSVAGIQAVSLQYGPAADEIGAFVDGFGIPVACWPGTGEDMDDFAAQVEALDLVVSMANTTVHVAAALGKPTWNLVPSAPSWRWGLEGERCPWYPSMRIFRQAAGQPWHEVIDRVALALAGHVAARRAMANEALTGGP